jgi:hypothetical protein
VIVALPPVALAVSPARVAVVAPASRTLELRNNGVSRLVVDIAAPKVWLSIRPDRVVLPGRSKAVVTMRVRARVPGDNRVLVLLTARPRARTSVAVRVRLGVRVRIHVRGRAVRRLAVGAPRVRRRNGARVVLLSVANHGNLAERLRRCLTVSLFRRGRLVARLRPRTRGELFPGERTVVALPYSGGVRGVVSAIVAVRAGERLVRRYRLRL